MRPKYASETEHASCSSQIATHLVNNILLLQGDSRAVSHLQELSTQIATTMISHNLVKADDLGSECPWAKVLHIDPLGCEAEVCRAAVVLGPEVMVD